MSARNDIEYHDELVAVLETVWGDGFLSPGGPTEVAMVLEGTDISGKQILDIGCGTGGADILLINEYEAAHVIGIDVEEPVIEASRHRAAREGLSGQITYRLVKPGPLLFEDRSFDVVFSKDAMIHIPDKAALFKDVFRILKPGGLFVASDWMRRDAQPPSADMRNYIKTEGLSFEMTPPEYYETALKKAGFGNVVLRDRNPWYAKLARKEYDQMKGPLYQTLVERAGQAETDRNIDVWRNMCVVLDSGELRPGHMKAVKPRNG